MPNPVANAILSGIGEMFFYPVVKIESLILLIIIFCLFYKYTKFNILLQLLVTYTLTFLIMYYGLVYPESIIGKFVSYMTVGFMMISTLIIRLYEIPIIGSIVRFILLIIYVISNLGNIVIKPIELISDNYHKNG